MSSRTFNFCNNCGRNGHAFHQCKHPITSTGVIAVRVGARGPEYLLIRRKDTLGFVDFMRGKYPLHSKRYLANIIAEMTESERQRLLDDTFDDLWSALWGTSIGIQYRGEERVSRDKLAALKKGIVVGRESYCLASLMAECGTQWKEPEWGFPKGRRNYQERDLPCALREFQEETGYPRSTLQIVQNLVPLEESFTGSNYKSYKHRYYVGFMPAAQKPVQAEQATEVSRVAWMPVEEARRRMRPYNQEKLRVLNRVDQVLRDYRIYRQMV